MGRRHSLFSGDAARTRQLSRREDENRSIIDTLLLIASVLQALANTLSTQLALAAIATVFLSWLLIHTVCALRYARPHCKGESDGSDISFRGDDAPDYLDFCYLAFAVGTAFKHDISSFLFAIGALALSVVSSLSGS